MTRAANFLNSPAVLAAANEMARRAKDRGEKVDPFFELDPTQQRIALRMDTLPPKDPNRTVLKRENAWYKDFSTARSAFFDSLPAGDPNKPKGPIDYPEASDQVKQLQDAYYQIKDPKMKRDFMLELGTDAVIAANAAAVTNKLQQMASGFVYNTKTQVSATPGKFDTMQEAVWFGSHKFDMLEEIWEENQRAPTLVVYNYKEELAELKRRFPKAQTIDDPSAIHRWNLGQISMLLIHPKSAGHGLNLQYGGNKIIFLSMPWSLELYEQTLGRLHRGGQTMPVWCYLLICNKTIDERIWGALQDKKAISNIALEELKA